MAQPLRVALDATPLSVSTGGVRRYTAELARALAIEFPEDSYHLVSDQQFEMPCALPNLSEGRPPITAWDRRWWTVGLAREMRRLRSHVFHGTDFAAPYVPLRPAVMTIHDLSPWRMGTAEFTSGRIRRRTPWMLRLGLATMVITPSEAIRSEVISRFGIAAGRVVATPLAASDAFRPVPPPSRPRPYFLCVGAGNPRKNLAVVQAAWTELRKTVDVDLVIAGDPTGPSVPDDDLPALYSGALAFLYPSLYEGFGLPLLEAMQCGAMVIASRDPALVETAGAAALHVDAADHRGWFQAMHAALSVDCRAMWRARGLSRAAQFSWKRTAILTREVYEQARLRF